MSRAKLTPPARARLLRRAAGRAALGLGLLALGCRNGVESRLADVRALQDVGQFAASIEELSEVLASEPDQAEANYRLGLALVQTGEPSRAVWPLQKATEDSDYAISAGILLASTHFQTQNFDEAIRAANRVLEVDPDRQAALRIRAGANLAARNLEAALADTERLVERHPDDYGVHSLHASVLADLGKIDEARREHDLLKRMGEESGDPQLRSRACLAPASFAADVLEDEKEAKRLYEECAAQKPTDTAVLNHMAGFFERVDDPARATELWRVAVQTAPEKLALRQGLAERLQALGRPAEAEQVLREAAEGSDSAEAWNLLSGFYRVQSQPQKALEALEKVIERGGDNEQVRFALADVLIDLNQLQRAREITESLTQPTFADLLRGRLHLVSGEPREALAAFEKGIRAWPNNAAARFLAAIAARDLGDYERAISEFREAVRSNNRDTDAALQLARIYLDLGHYDSAVAFANLALRGRGVQQPEPYVIAARGLAATNQIERARKAIDGLSEQGYPVLAARERAALERRLRGPQAAVAVADASGIDLGDVANLELLREVVDALVTGRDAAAGVARIDRALERSPAHPRLLELRGAALIAAGRADQARAAFEQVLAVEPENAVAIAGLAALRAAAGDPQEAVRLYDRAYALAPRQGEFAYSSAQLVLASGDTQAATERLHHIIRFHPGIVGARNDLAWMLAESGDDLELALKLVSDAQRQESSPAVLDTAGWVHYRRNEFTEAVMMLEIAVAEVPDDPSMRYRLALALEKAGNRERARSMLEEAVALGTFPEVEDARRHLAELAGS